MCGSTELAPSVRTRYEVVRRTAIQTLLALGLVLPATAFGVFWLYGGDLSNSVSGHAALGFCLALAGVETLIFAPTVAIRSRALSHSVPGLRRFWWPGSPTRTFRQSRPLATSSTLGLAGSARTGDHDPQAHPCARTNAKLPREIQQSGESDRALAARLGFNPSQRYLKFQDGGASRWWGPRMVETRRVWRSE